MKIAVIGTGIAGMSCAWLLNQRHEVTVYEADARLGGHTHTVEVATPQGPIGVDTGFIVYNEVNYPNLTQLFAALGVETKPSIMSFAVSQDDGALEYSGGSLGGLFGQWRNLARPAFLRMVGEILRFYREAPGLLDRPDAAAQSLGQYLAAQRYSRFFIEHHILPMGAAIWSCSVAQMMDFPITSFVRFCANHGLLKVTGRPDWRTVTGGSRAYLEKLTAPYRARIRLGTPVTAIRPLESGVEVTDASGDQAIYDQVVLACHGDQASAMLRAGLPEAAALLGAFTYQPNRAILHRDVSVMPRRRAIWSSWNYAGKTGIGQDRAVAVTYWMNLLQALPDHAPPLFVSLNPINPIDPALIEREQVYEHPVFDQPAINAQRGLAGIQGRDGIWYCGSYCGWGFHEDGLSSGMAVAQALGCPTPWPAAPSHAAAAVA